MLESTVVWSHDACEAVLPILLVSWLGGKIVDKALVSVCSTMLGTVADENISESRVFWFHDVCNVDLVTKLEIIFAKLLSIVDVEYHPV